MAGNRITLGTAAAVTASVVAVTAFASPASAGLYTVLSCKDRAGARAPLSDSTGGWLPGPTGPGLDAVDNCASPSDGFQATISGPASQAVGTQVHWRFVPPAGTLVAGADILWSGTTRPWNGQNRGIIALHANPPTYLATSFGEGTIAPRWLIQRGLNDGYFQAMAQCDGPIGAPDCAPGFVAEIDVLRSEMILSDTSPPTAGRASGSAVDDATWRGTHVFEFSASDEGGGVYQAIVQVDGAPALARTLDDWGGRCVDTTGGDLVFRYPRPCPTQVDGFVAVDPNALPEGEHDVAVVVSDAAGNTRTVYSARKTIVPLGKRVGPGSNPTERGAANGDNPADDARLTARWLRTRRSTLTGRYGRRQVIRGRLTNAEGVGIRNARIELLSAIDGRGAALLDEGGARTRGDGRFTLILPRNVSSRTLVLRYRSHADDTVAATERTLRLNVRAGVRLTVRPHTAARGRTVRLSGRLVGRPLPRRGKVVELQARTPGAAWITFRTVRASRTGRFATRYTFRRGGPATYQMRARVRAADDYPYSTGTSHAVRVRVR